MSIFPKFNIVSSIIFSQSDSIETSATLKIDSPQFLLILNEISFKEFSDLATKTTLAPNFENSNAHDFPIPDEAPVIMTTLLFKT